MELPGQKEVPFLGFWGKSILFSTVPVQVCIPANSVLGFPFSTALPALFCWCIYIGHSDHVEVVSHCAFNLHLSDASLSDQWCWASFHISLHPCYVLLGAVSVQVLCLFFNWIVCLPGAESCEFYIYFGEQTFVQGVTSKYIFPYGWFPFHFADIFFSHAEDFIFDEVPFVYSYLYVPCSRRHIGENITAWKSWYFPAHVLL